MAVVHLVFPCRTPDGPPANAASVAISVLTPTHDAEAVIRAIVSGLDPAAGRPRVEGLLAELQSRPGRSVTSWFAAVGDSPVGCIVLVTAGAGASARHSISWLLVSGHARRRGVGRTLVTTAIDAARVRGAREVWAETRAEWTTAVAFWLAVGFRPVA